MSIPEELLNSEEDERITRLVESRKRYFIPERVMCMGRGSAYVIARSEEIKQKAHDLYLFRKRVKALKEYEARVEQRSSTDIPMCSDGCGMALAMDHSFGEEMACERCGTSFREHQKNPKWCKEHPINQSIYEYLSATKAVAHLLPIPEKLRSNK